MHHILGTQQVKKNVFKQDLSADTGFCHLGHQWLRNKFETAEQFSCKQRIHCLFHYSQNFSTTHNFAENDNLRFFKY